MLGCRSMFCSLLGSGLMLVLISPPTAAPNEHAVIDALFRHGLLQRFHLRKKPEWSDAEIARFVDRVGSYRDRIVLHTARPTLAAELGLAGVHYTEASRPPPPLPAPGGGLSVSTSFHRLPQLVEADWGPALSYAFLSPIFDSISKEGYPAAGFNRRQLQDAVRTCGFPVIALGGIAPKNMGEVKSMGFAGAAAIGSVWQTEDPVAAFAQLQDAWLNGAAD